MTPVCTLMIGRLDDWLRVLVGARRRSRSIPMRSTGPGSRSSSGPYGLYRERGYRTRLLAAAYRHRLHWTELVGGDVILTMPHAWQVRFNESGITPEDRIDVPVDPAMVGELLDRFRTSSGPTSRTA